MLWIILSSFVQFARQIWRSFHSKSNRIFCNVAPSSLTSLLTPPHTPHDGVRWEVGELNRPIDLYNFNWSGRNGICLWTVGVGNVSWNMTKTIKVLWIRLMICRKREWLPCSALSRLCREDNGRWALTCISRSVEVNGFHDFDESLGWTIYNDVCVFGFNEDELKEHLSNACVSCSWSLIADK